MGTGHHYRVLYLAMSPDGESIVTGAGDETLISWNVFSKARSQKEAKSALNLFTSVEQPWKEDFFCYYLVLKVGDRYKNDISLLQGFSANCQKENSFQKL